MDKQKELRREIPRVLICAPTSDRHSHLIDEWIEHLENLTYTNFDVCLVDNSLKGNEYFKKLSKLKVQGRKVITWKHKWNTQDTNHLQMLAHVREDIRKYFLENDYTHLLYHKILKGELYVNDYQTMCFGCNGQKGVKSKCTIDHTLTVDSFILYDRRILKVKKKPTYI